MEYMNVGHSFPRNHDIDGKKMLIVKSILHVKGKRENKELIRIFVYWMERLQRSNDYDSVTLFFDLANCGLKHLDLDYTVNVVNILKAYYPYSVNYILVYEMPWMFAGKIFISIELINGLILVVSNKLYGFLLFSPYFRVRNFCKKLFTTLKVYPLMLRIDCTLSWWFTKNPYS